MKMIKRLEIRAALLAVLMFALFSPGKAEAGGGSQAQPSGGAGGPSGKIVIYTSMYEDIIEAMDEALEKAFPNCDIEFFYGGTGTLQAKIAAEKDSGKLGCDMLMVAEPAYSLELKEYGMLHPYKSKEAGALDFDYDPDGYWYPVRVCNMVLAYNPEKAPKNSIPNSLYDFAYNSDVKGAISMSNPLTSGTAMASVTALKDKYGYEYFTALGNQGVMVESGSVALTKLETGECKVIMILEESVLKKREEEGSKLEVIYPTDGTIIIPSTIMTVDAKWSANNNTAAAELITDWFLSNAGQANVVAGWMHSVRKDYPKPPYDGIPTAQIKANNMPVNWENCFRQREEIRTKFEEAVTSRR
ncbi:MAG: ABC transporter substrate-binding protein [Treponema sp.]|nr:ABC transporter substrate-binding protein [Treponema sp.]